MRVLVAPDRYGDLLTAGQAAEAIAAGWSAAAQSDELRILPLGNGGPGWLSVLEAGLRAAPAASPDGIPASWSLSTHALTVADPWGRAVPAELLLVDSVQTSGQTSGQASMPTGRHSARTAYLEASQILGGHTRRPTDDPGEATSRGLGSAILEAVAARAQRIVVGLTGALVLDAGFGLLAEIAGRPRPEMVGGALALSALTPDDDLTLTTARAHLGGARLVALGDLSQPLLGLQGVAATFGTAAGADPVQAQRIEAALGCAVDLARRARPEPADLISGAAVRVDRAPGAGAGAGIGFAFALLGAELLDGAAGTALELGLDDALDGVDLLVTGEAELGWESLRGGPVTTAAAAAARRGIPTVVVAGRVAAGRRETMAAGINGAYAVCASLAQWPGFAARPADALAERVAAVARTWSPHALA